MELKDLKGLGKKKLEYLEQLNIYNIEDLIYYFPKRYENRKDLYQLRDLKGKGLVHLEVLSRPQTLSVRKGLKITKFLASDGEYQVEINFFNTPYMAYQIHMGQKYYFYGELEFFNNKAQMSHPIFSKYLGEELGQIVPVYSLTEGITQKNLRDFIHQTLSYKRNTIRNVLPDSMREAQHFMSKEEAFWHIHFPDSFEKLKEARRVMHFEKLLVFQLALREFGRPSAKPIIFSDNGKIEEFIKSLPFELTQAQEKVMKEIFKDMESDKVMNRLVQGDVGSGKTMIASLAILKAYYNGYQSVFLAPTEILATQHLKSIEEDFKKLDLEIGLLKGSLTRKEKEKVLEKLSSGQIDCLVTTHAVLEDEVQFKNLGLVVVDEQHRFGVSQRAVLSQKNERADILIMTATPIPRTTVLAFYSDLDLSVIDELPPGRQEIKTYALDIEAENQMVQFLREEVKKGHQAYIVCPLIEESEKIEAFSLEEIVERLAPKLRGISWAVIHGKMKTEEKDEIMEAYQKNKISVLFSTTVIEVGVNVPNANLMIIYNAERFGLSQLHQLRGRVGRSDIPSFCFLMNRARTEIAFERMKIMEQTNDGFEIALRDLELRGGGDLIGVRQSGESFLDLENYDEKILVHINALADHIHKNEILNQKEFFNLKKAVEELISEMKETIIMN